MEKYISIPKDAIYKNIPNHLLYKEISIDSFNKKIYNPNYATGSLDLQKTIEESSLIELEVCIFYFKGKFNEIFTKIQYKKFSY